MNHGPLSRLYSHLTLATFTVALLAAVWGAVFYQLDLERDDARMLVTSESRLGAQIYQEQVRRTFRQVEQSSLFLKYIFEHAGGAQGLERAFNASRIAGENFDGTVVVTDASGMIIATSAAAAPEHVSLASDPLFRQISLSHTNGLVIGAATQSGGAQQWTAPIGIRLEAADGGFAGMLMISLDPMIFADLDDASAIGTRGAVGLLGADGRFRIERLGTAVQVGVPADEALVAAIGAPGETPVLLASGDGVRRVYTMRRIDDLPLYAVIGISEEDALAGYRGHRSSYMAVAAFVSIAILAFIFALMFQTRRLQQNRRAAQRAERTLRAAVEGTLDAFYLLESIRDETGAIVDFVCIDLNEAGAQMLRLPRAELLGVHVLKLSETYRTSGLFDKYVGVVESGKAIEEVFEVQTPMIHASWLQHQLVPVGDGLAVISRDISEKKLLEDETRNDRAFFKTLFEHLPVLVYAKSTRPETFGQFLIWNEAAEVATGYKSSQMLGKTDDQIFPRAVARRNKEFVAELLDNPMIVDIPEQRFVRPDGTVRFFHSILVPVYSDRDDPDYVLGISEDITARREQALELQVKSAEIAAVNDASPLGLFRCDAAGRNTYSNQALEHISGLDREHALGHGWLAAVHPEDRSRVHVEWDRSIEQRLRYETTFRYLHASGKTLWADMRVAPIIVDDSVTGFVGTVDDITDRRETSEARKMLAAILEASSDFVASNDANGFVTYLNPAGRRLRGIDLNSDVTQSRAADYYPQWVVDKLRNEAVPAAIKEGTWLGETAVYDRNGREVPLNHMVIAHLGPDGRLESVSGIMRDISEAKRAEHALKKSEARLRTVADALPMLVSYIDTTEHYRFVNRSYENLFRLERQQIVGMTIRELRGEADYARYQPHIQQALSGEVVIFEDERRELGRYVCRQVTYIPEIEEASGEVLGFHEVVQDITDVKLSERRLRRLAELDPLTQLLNRAGFEHRLNDSFARSKRDNSWMALLYLDVDYFKKINDSLGHLAGDALLKAFAQRLQACCRASDTVARLGGDEFAIIVDTITHTDHVERMAKKILAAVRKPLVIDGASMEVTTSIGIALYRGEDRQPRELVREADEMLYQAKGSGRNAYCISGRPSAQDPITQA